MKNAFALFFALAFSLQGADVQFVLSNLAGGAVTNRNVIIGPYWQTPSGAIGVLDKSLRVTDASGQFTVTNMQAGLYDVQVMAPPAVTKFTILVPTSMDTLQASALIVVRTNSTLSPLSYAYSTTASDARYQPLGSTGGGTNYVNGSDLALQGLTLTNYNKTMGVAVTNALAAQGSAITNAIQSATNGFTAGIPSGARATNFVMWNSFTVDAPTTWMVVTNDSGVMKFLAYGDTNVSVLSLDIVQNSVRFPMITSDRVLGLDTDGILGATGASFLEASYLSGTRSNLQAQIDWLSSTGGNTNGTAFDGTALTNFVLLSATNSTNFAKLVGTSSTNLALTVSTNATNFTKTVGQSTTNLALTVSTNSTNFAKLVGQTLTNLINGLPTGGDNSWMTNGVTNLGPVSFSGTNATLTLPGDLTDPAFATAGQIAFIGGYANVFDGATWLEMPNYDPATPSEYPATKWELEQATNAIASGLYSTNNNQLTAVLSPSGDINYMADFAPPEMVILATNNVYFASSTNRIASATVSLFSGVTIYNQTGSNIAVGFNGSWLHIGTPPTVVTNGGMAYRAAFANQRGTSETNVLYGAAN